MLLFLATTAQIAIFTNQILIDNVVPTYNFNTLLLFAIALGIYKVFDLFTTLIRKLIMLPLPIFICIKREFDGTRQ
jgi:subfamily B ATP-binding cassette protein HlyB/CyaB